MNRMSTALIAVFLLLAGSLASVSAQTATPGAKPSGGIVPLGTPVTLLDGAKSPGASIMVNAIVDPFTDFDPTTAPADGFRFIAIRATLFVAGASSVSLNGTFSAIDTAGFSYQTANVNRTGDTANLNDIAYLNANPGDVSQGIAIFQLPVDAKLVRVDYEATDSPQWITLLNLSTSLPKLGHKTTIVDDNGKASLKISVSKFLNPLKGVNPGSSAQAGFIYAGIILKIGNAGSKSISISPSTFYVVDDNNFSWEYTGARRTDDALAAQPDLPYDSRLEPGKTVSGVIAFQIPKGSVLNRVEYAPDHRTVELVNLGHTGIQADAPPPASATTSTPPPSVVVAPTPDVSGVDCDRVVAWSKTVLIGTNPTYSKIAADALSWQKLPTASIDIASVQADADLAASASKLVRDTPYPTVLNPLVAAYQSVFGAYATWLDQLAKDLAAKDDAAIATDFAGLNLAASGFTDPQLGPLTRALAAACPALTKLS